MFVMFFVFILLHRHKSRESMKIGPHPRGHPSSKTFHTDKKAGAHLLMQELIARLCGHHFSELQNHYSHPYGQHDEEGLAIVLPDSEQDPMRIHLAKLEYLVRDVEVERYNELFNNDELRAQLAKKDKQHLEQE
jgi:hypothetical protein